MDRDELARRLLATFAAEVEEQVRALNADLLALEKRPDDPDRLQSVFRIAHSLKGAARAAGVPLVEQVCHALESRLAELRQGKRTIGEADVTLFFAAVDALGGAVHWLREGRDPAESALPELLRMLTGGVPPAGRRQTAVQAAEATPPPAPPGRQEQLRVHAGKLDGLLAATGELLVERGRIAHATDEIVALAEDVAAFAVRWHATGRVLRLAAERGQVGPRVQVAIRDLDADVQRLFRRTGQLAGAASRDARSVAGVVDRVAERSHGLRMRPFGETAEPLARTVRDLAKASGKEVRLEIVGAEVEADRAVLDGLRDALLQLVRNAVDHGIESPAERERRDKPRTGTVRVAAALAGDRILVEVTDDGAGLDAGRIRTVLAARGLPAPADDAALGDALLSGGISTRTEADAISGRGVGLDIVRNAVQRIQGGIRVTWEAGAGSTFTIECRPSLATTRAVLVGVGGALLAIPTTHIARVLRVRLADIRQVQGRPVITTDQGPVPLVSLARLLGPPLTDRPVGDVVPAALLEYGQQRIAVAVDELVAEAEVVVRPIQQDGMPARYVSGATVLGSGRVAPVLNAAAVVAAGLGVTTGGLELAEREVQPRRHRILVVDDSITTRTLEESVLEAAGYEVLTAVDGADAWRVLQEQGCDLVVADVDMPRMDGFDLCRSIRTSKRFKELPVVLVTALEAPEHRRRGMEVGADAYIGKSGFDQEQLLKTIRQFLD